MVSKNINFYEILGVSKNASQDDLDEAYVKAATKNHRDHDDDPEKFKEVKQAYGEAYMVLSNPLEREIHDQYCEDGGRRRDFIHPLMVSLEDLYNGTTRNIPLFRRSVTCSKCKGIGGSITTDEGCFQQQCEGEKVVEDKFHKDFEVHIEKGMQGWQKIRFSGEALNGVSGGRGMVVILLQQEHPVFKRKGDDLFVELTLSATQALWGFQIGLTHLDNREIIIQSPHGEIVEHDQVKVINDEGMPMYQRPFMRGKLYIHFKVDFTSPKLLSTDMEEVDETTTLDHVNIEDEMRRKMKICPPSIKWGLINQIDEPIDCRVKETWPVDCFSLWEGIWCFVCIMWYIKSLYL